MNRRRRHPAVALLAAVAALALAACSGGPDPGGGQANPERPAVLGAQLGSASLSGPGAVIVGEAGLDRAPRYDLRATIEPESGTVDATMIADLPRADDGSPLRFRVFPNLPAFDAGFVIDDALVDGQAVQADLDRSLLSLDVPTGGEADRVTVELAFSYTVATTDLSIDPLASFAGNALNPADIGLLGLHPGGASLGHWFPIWMETESSAEPEPDGFGDIANFPAAMFSATIDVPAGWQVFTGGKTVERRDEGGRATYQEEGVGLRDLSIYAGRDVETTEVQVSGVTVRTISQASHADVLPEVSEEAAAALEILADAFGPYPWAELDVIDVPLGSGVGGMEWPGAIWIETTTFGGGIPGLGGLGGLEGLLGGGGGGLLGGEGFLGGESGLSSLLGAGALESLREFIIAHEVAHQWWHALVGNDSISAPVLDEPLAQFSACHYLRVRSPEEGDEQCALHTDGQYQGVRALGEADAAANQRSDEFASSLQYGAVVYGKAPGLFEELRELLGEEAVLTALRSYVDDFAFAIARPDDLRHALRNADPGRAGEVDALWMRWFEEAHGDEDIGLGSPLDGLGGLGGLSGLEGLEGLEDLEALGPEFQELLSLILEGLGDG